MKRLVAVLALLWALLAVLAWLDELRSSPWHSPRLPQWVPVFQDARIPCATVARDWEDDTRLVFYHCEGVPGAVHCQQLDRTECYVWVDSATPPSTLPTHS